MKNIVTLVMIFMCFASQAQPTWTTTSGYLQNDTGTHQWYVSKDTTFAVSSYVLRDSAYILRRIYRDTTYPIVYQIRQKDSIIIYDHLRFMQDKCNKLSDKYAKKAQEAFLRNEMAKGAHNMIKSSYFEGMSDTYVELIYLRKWENDGKKHTIQITSYE